MAKNATHFEYDGFSAIEGKFDLMTTTNAQVREAIRKATWEVLGEVRKAAISKANFKNSRHNSIQAIRRSVYKKIMGGSVSILDGKRKANSGSFKATGRSARTQQIEGYSGRDRGFILRFVNSGTDDRYAGEGRNTKMGRDYIQSKRGKPGFRGAIKATNFFGSSAGSAIQPAADKLAQMIEDEITKQFNNG